MTRARDGYRSKEFAATYRHEGSPIDLAASGSSLVRRPIPSSPDRADAISCYPLLTCAEWAALPDDLAGLVGIVSVTAVVDPVADVDRAVLHRAFPDLLVPFKQHLVVDLGAYGPTTLSTHHRRNVARGHRHCRVTRVDPPSSIGDAWVGLYAQLRARHGITGRADLPPAALADQLAVPGAVAWRADVAGELAGIVVWMTSGSTAYYHLAAYSSNGYDQRAAYALFDVALRELADGARVAVLGSGAGVGGLTDDDGLVRFKRGWGTFERDAMLGGRIVDRATYDELSAGVGESFFPAYRGLPSDGAAVGTS